MSGFTSELVLPSGHLVGELPEPQHLLDAGFGVQQLNLDATFAGVKQQAEVSAPQVPHATHIDGHQSLPLPPQLGQQCAQQGELVAVPSRNRPEADHRQPVGILDPNVGQRHRRGVLGGVIHVGLSRADHRPSPDRESRGPAQPAETAPL